MIQIWETVDRVTQNYSRDHDRLYSVDILHTSITLMFHGGVDGALEHDARFYVGTSV